MLWDEDCDSRIVEDDGGLIYLCMEGLRMEEQTSLSSCYARGEAWRVDTMGASFLSCTSVLVVRARLPAFACATDPFCPSPKFRLPQIASSTSDTPQCAFLAVSRTTEGV